MFSSLSYSDLRSFHISLSLVITFYILRFILLILLSYSDLCLPLSDFHPTPASNSARNYTVPDTKVQSLSAGRIWPCSAAKFKIWKETYQKTHKSAFTFFFGCLSLSPDIELNFVNTNFRAISTARRVRESKRDLLGKAYFQITAVKLLKQFS